MYISNLATNAGVQTNPEASICEIYSFIESKSRRACPDEVGGGGGQRDGLTKFLFITQKFAEPRDVNSVAWVNS